MTNSFLQPLSFLYWCRRITKVRRVVYLCTGPCVKLLVVNWSLSDVSYMGDMHKSAKEVRWECILNLWRWVKSLCHDETVGVDESLVETQCCAHCNGLLLWPAKVIWAAPKWAQSRIKDNLNTFFFLANTEPGYRFTINNTILKTVLLSTESFERKSYNPNIWFPNCHLFVKITERQFSDIKRLWRSVNGKIIQRCILTEKRSKIRNLRMENSIEDLG